MVATPRTKTRLEALYDETIAPKVAEKFGLRNKHQWPRMTKIVLNCGIGRFLENQKLKPEIRDTFISTLTAVSGQKPIMVVAKKSVSNFKVREGAPSGFVVTLRRDRMWHFFDRLVNLGVPRIRDFRGLKDKAFDKQGNYSMGLHEQAIWPEINMSTVNFTHGMNINIVFENSNPQISLFTLSELGMPFVRHDDT